MGGEASGLFIQLGLVLIVAGVVTYILRLIKQPQILAYILVGIFLTPVLGIVTDLSLIESMSIIGIAFLLFLVGIEIDLKRLKTVTLVSVFGGGMQILLLFIFGYLIALLLGFLNLEAAYIGLMLAFSSTMIVMKLLSDRRELSTLHGRIIIGILLLQDLVAIFALSILTSVSNFSLSLFGVALLKFFSLFLVFFLFNRYLFPQIFKFAAKNSELLLISSLAVCFFFSFLFLYIGKIMVFLIQKSGFELSQTWIDYLTPGFSIAIGAFLAGVSLGNLDYNLEIVSKIKSLRDFFALLFFVSLGMKLNLGVLKTMLLPLLIFMFLVVFLKPFVIMFVCSLFRYTQKPSFLSAISLSQIGEFSLIVASQGLLLGHISSELFSLIVLVMLLSITLTPYLINYSDWFYKKLNKFLQLFEIFSTAEGMEYTPKEIKPTIILCGHNRIGYSILKGLKKSKKRILIVDFNPEVIEFLVRQKYHCLYGDAADEEIIEKMNLKEIKLFISTIPDTKDTLRLIREIRKVNKKAKVIVTASEITDALRFYKTGADYVILPHFLGGEHASNLIKEIRKGKKELDKEKEEHIKYLIERKEIGHEHPAT